MPSETTDPSPDSEQNAGGSPGNKDAQPGTDTTGPRVWRACLPCRRKKVKCDGKQPCYNCSSRNQDCGFPETKDNAAASRHYATSFEARCQQMTSLCERLESLTSQLSLSIDVLNGHSVRSTSFPNGLNDGAQADLLQAAHVLRSMPELRTGTHSHRFRAPIHDGGQAATTSNSRHPEHLSELGDEDLDDISNSLDVDDDPNSLAGESRDAGAMIRDSYGHLRFVGGASNTMLIEAARQSVSPNVPTGPSPQGVDTASTRQGTTAGTDGHVELPIFVRGKVWPELPFLPRPDQLSRPPQYVADLLIRLYFDQLHYTFPVVFKPDFMQRYRQMFRSGGPQAQEQSSASTDRRFLLVFYAICACASSLLPPSSDSGFPGLEYYEKALLLYYASTGEASLERVQCLALLSMCAAGWNTITQSWTLAGQAVRAAQDIGIHLSAPFIQGNTKTSPRLCLLERQISRRVWWSTYILDRTTSICLGRPMAAHDEDCSWEMPLNISDEELEHQLALARHQPNASPSLPGTLSPPTTGFLCFARLCRISGKVQQLSTPHRLRELTSLEPGRSEKFRARVSLYDQALRKWLDTLPDSIRFSANSANADGNGSTDLIMCVVSFIVHAGSLLNLYRCFIGHNRHTATAGFSDATNPEDAVSQCRSAARSCINAAEMVRDLVPPSHHLAICVHYLTLSGVVLLRLPSDCPQAETIADVQKCAGFLKDLEQRWSGAARSRAIIERLLCDYCNESLGATDTQQQTRATLDLPVPFDGTMSAGLGAGQAGKRTFGDFDAGAALDLGDEDMYMSQVLGSELFAFENMDPGLMGPWGRL